MCEERNHSLALGGETAQQLAHPTDPLRVEAVDRLVEHDDPRVAEQRRSDPEPLLHPERERPSPLPRHGAQPDEVDQLFDALVADPMCLRERAQVVSGRPSGVNRMRLEHRADLVQRRGDVAVDAAVDQRGAGVRRVEPEDQPHRRRLAGPIRSKESGDHPRLDREGDVVYSEAIAIPLG